MSGAGQKQTGPRASLAFPRTARLLKHAAFDRVYKEGRRIFSGNITVFFRRRDEGDEPAGARVGFTVSRAMGGAVQRNRIKRRLREAVRRYVQTIEAPVDVVINPKRTAISAEFTALTIEVERAFSQIGQRCGARASVAEAMPEAERRRATGSRGAR